MDETIFRIGRSKPPPPGRASRGKPTLVRAFAGRDRAYVTLDDDAVLAGVRGDLAGFLLGRDRAVIEVRGGKPAFLKAAFAGRIVRAQHVLADDELVDAVLTGGYPEMLRRKTPPRRQAWAREYLNALLQRDVSDIAGVEKLDGMSRLFRTLAHQSGALVNFAQAGGRIRLDEKTARKYVTIFEQLFVVRRVEPWLRNRLKRLVKTPKLHFLDSGLLAATLGATAPRLAKDRALLGPLLEAFVFSEVLKQSQWLDEACVIHHFRDKDQAEVDLVLENPGGEIVGIEVKAAATVGPADFKGLRKLADACGKGLKLGVVLYDGDQVAPFGERMFAAPVSCLWG